MKKLMIRLKVCFRILTMKDRHWFVYAIDEQNLIELIKGADFNVSVMYHGLQTYQVKLIIKAISDSIDDIDMILAKADFEANCQLWK